MVNGESGCAEKVRPDFLWLTTFGGWVFSRFALTAGEPPALHC